MTPDEGHGARTNLCPSPDRRQRALGYGGAAVDKWLCERPFADGRAAVYEHWRRKGCAAGLRHTVPQAPKRDIFPIDELNRSITSLERKDRRAQEDP
jgi:hypothetical protein